MAVLWRHALRNAWLPILTLIGLQFGALLAGAVITGTVFAWPGLGSLLVEAIQQRDYPVVQGAVLLISLTYVLVNGGTDLAYGLLDPRTRRVTPLTEMLIKCLPGICVAIDLKLFRCWAVSESLDSQSFE